MNTLRYPANNPGLFGEISSNLLVIELLLNAEDLKTGDLKNEFLEHLVDPSSTRDLSLMFQNVHWPWLDYLEYISSLFQRTQECFLTVTRKFAYALQDKSTSTAFKNLVRDFDQKLGGFYIENWRRHLDRMKNPKDKLRILRRNFTMGLMHSFGRLLICSSFRINRYLLDSKIYFLTIRSSCY
jgi:hypothetical protein